MGVSLPVSNRYDAALKFDVFSGVMGGCLLLVYSNAPRLNGLGVFVYVRTS